MNICFLPPKKILLLSSFSLASTRSIFVSINKARDEIRCHCYNKRICDNGKNSNAFQDPVPDACSTRRVCLLQKKQEPKCLKYCMIWSSCPHFTRCFYVVFIQESLSENKFSYWTGRFWWTRHIPTGWKFFYPINNLKEAAKMLTEALANQDTWPRGQF